MSRVHREEGEWAEAENYARRAVEIAQAVNHPDLAEYEALLAEIEAGPVDEQGGILKQMWKWFGG